MQHIAPPAFPSTGQAPMPAFAGNPLDGSSTLWRKAAGTATVPAGQPAATAAKPRAPFNTLLESLVNAADADNPKRAPAIKKEDGSQANFWMAMAAATPLANQPAKQVSGGADAEADAPAGTPTDGRPSGQSAEGAPGDSPSALPEAIGTSTGSGREPQARLALPQGAALTTENDVPDGALPATGELTAGAAAPLEHAPDGNLPPVSQDPANQESAKTWLKEHAAEEGLRQGAAINPREQRSGATGAQSQRGRDVTEANETAELPQTARVRSAAQASVSAAPATGAEGPPEDLPEADGMPSGSDGRQALPVAPVILPRTPPDTALPAGGQPPPALAPAAEPGANAKRKAPAAEPGANPKRPDLHRDPGASAENWPPGAAAAAGHSLPRPETMTPAEPPNQPQARTAERGGIKVTATEGGQPSAKSTLASEPLTSALSDAAAGNSAARPMVVAFTARLRPVEAGPDAPAAEPTNGASEPVKAEPASDKASATGEAAPAGQDKPGSDPAGANRQPEVREPDRKPDVASDVTPELAAAARPADTPQPPAASGVQLRVNNPATPPPAATAEATTTSQPPRAGAAHDIKLELAGQGDQRVEVRVSERAGDMHVEVRTPNTGLAGDLREDLPALASKLEQTGFRADTWRPAGTADRQGTAQTAPGGASQNFERQAGQNGGQQRRDQQPQPRPKVPESDTPSPDAGKDFSWLFSSIQ